MWPGVIGAVLFLLRKAWAAKAFLFSLVFIILSLIIDIIGGTFALNVIDIKDFEGDKKAGIKTLPVLIGLKPAKFILGITFLVGHLLGFLFTDSSTTYFVLVGLGILQLIFITSKKYSDSKVVGTFLIAILITALEKFF